jgi:hypothetical protein
MIRYKEKGRTTPTFLLQSNLKLGSSPGVQTPFRMLFLYPTTDRNRGF